MTHLLMWSDTWTGTSMQAHRQSSVPTLTRTPSTGHVNRQSTCGALPQREASVGKSSILAAQDYKQLYMSVPRYHQLVRVKWKHPLTVEPCDGWCVAPCRQGRERATCKRIASSVSPPNRNYHADCISARRHLRTGVDDPASSVTHKRQHQHKSRSQASVRTPQIRGLLVS